jgi:signal transduction histidine kinase
MVSTSIDKKNKPETEEITETNRQRFQEIERLTSLGEILGGVAHEINNPLQIILGKSQILMMRIAKEQSSPKSMEDLKTIEKGAQRIAELINSLADLNQPKSEDKKLKTDVDISYLVSSILSLVKASLKDKKIELNINLPENLPKVKGNPSQLKELFFYLILNAKHRISFGGNLEMSLGKEDGYLRVEFNDQGEELPEEILRRAVDYSTLRIENKSTFGILNSYLIMKEHKGDLEIRRSPGKGNIMVIRLPIV